MTLFGGHYEESSDFNFGLDRSGSIETLKTLGNQRGFEVYEIKAENAKLSTGQTVRVSSTTIRYMLTSGNVADASVLLGRPYRLMGKIISGKGKGKQLGFPTLNLEKPSQIIPAEGVYAGTIEIAHKYSELFKSKEKLPAVFSIGQARTYGDEHPLLIEAHLLVDNAGELTGQYMAMDFMEFIRTQHKFKTEGDLAKQIKEDCGKAKEILL